MYTKFIFLVIIIFEAEASLPDNVIFKIQADQRNTLTCDHSDEKKHQNKYTVLEGEQFTIVTKYEHTINHVICHAYNNENDYFNIINKLVRYGYMKNVSSFTVEKKMGNLWNCTILAHQNSPIMKPVVHYKNEDFAAAYCFMRIHVRPKEQPQTMLVNQMVVLAISKNLSEKDVDFMAEYQYADGDVVNVACANFLTGTQLTMEYKMAGTTSHKSTMKDITSSRMIGFVTKLHSRHNNSYVICTSTELTDYTKVMLRFVMRTKPNIISIEINGMILRPTLTVAKINHYEIKYKFAINQIITVTCEVEQTDVQLVVVDDDLDKSRSRKTELIPNKKTEIKFYLKKEDNKSLACAADNVTGGQAESVHIRFTTADFPIDYYPSLHMELPSSGTVMELYSYGDYKLTVLIYEFKHDETLQLTCGSLVPRVGPGPILYLQLNSNEICKTSDCTVSTTLEHLTHENMYPPQICYLKEIHAPELPSTTRDTVFKEIRVILRDRGLTTEPSTTTLSTAFMTDIFYSTAEPTPTSKTSEDSGDNSMIVYSLSALGVVTMVMLLLVLSYKRIKKQCCVRSSAPIPAPKIDPASAFYENLLSVFTRINEREAAEAAAAAEPTSAEEHNYEEIH